ncbi:hypothetical protein pipiens_015730 [Culex pipiens pipiens]|uniref:Uncharacterized protein n=1 Tax=Culex pipiens pipiens TaxID=38569 RepID=A0ABD1CP77_CULPP
MEREYDQQVQQHDGQYRDGRNDGSRYSSDRMANYNNKKKLLNQRSSKEKDRRGSDCKVTTSLQFKNQTRNKTNDCGLPMVGPGGVAGGQVVHSNSAGALSGSVQSNKMNKAIVLPVGGVPERMLDQRPQAPIQQAQPQPQQIQQQQLHQQQSPYDDHYDLLNRLSVEVASCVRWCLVRVEVCGLAR